MTRVLAVLGLVALVAAGLVARTGPAPDVGDPVTTSPTTARNVPVVEAPAVEATTIEPTQVPAVGTSSARLADRVVPVVPRPVRITIPRLAVDAEVVPVGVDPEGLMAVPGDVDEVGWYRHGPAPGREGSAVLAGHVDSRTQGLGVFAGLTRLQVGDGVEVVDASGDRTSWTVTGRQTFDKASLPVADLYAREGPARLVLITCGGDFDADAQRPRSPHAARLG